MEPHSPGTIPQSPWKNIISPPIPGRLPKPRTLGVTMVMDKGRGLEEIRDLLDLAGEYIDFIKLAFGTSALYPARVLAAKIEVIKCHHCEVYPGGTYLEIAYLQGRTEEYLKRAKELGFTAIEVSDGTVEMPSCERSILIRRAADLGFRVLTEVGKKDPRRKSSGREMAGVLVNDLEAGAEFVIIEGRESGRGVGVYDREGHIERERMDGLIEEPGIQERVIWEAPLKEQQETLIRLFGPNVSVGNIPPQDVLALESMRQGLRNDTLKACLEAVRHEYAALV